MRPQTGTAPDSVIGAGRVRRWSATVSLVALLAAMAAGCSLGKPGLSCAAVDAAAFSSPEQLAHASDAVVRGHVDGHITPRAGDTGLVTETYSLTVDDVIAVADAKTVPSVGSVLFVAMSVLDPRCPAGATPTTGYTDYPLAGEVPAAGTEVIAFVTLADVKQGGVPSSLGYASVDGDRATFAGVTGDLRGKTDDVSEIEDAAATELTSTGG